MPIVRSRVFHYSAARRDWTFTLARLVTSIKWFVLTGLLLCIAAGGCASIRITDPDHTADELYLENVASKLAVDQLSATVLRDRKVYLETKYLTSTTQPTDQQMYMVGELRAKLLLTGVRLTEQKKDAEIIMELRSQGISVDHTENLFGLPSSSVGGVFTGGVAAITPEIAIAKTTLQDGFSSVAFIAYWADSGEVVTASGPYVGRTNRHDYWLFGFGPSTIGNIPPAQPAPDTSGGSNSPPQSQPQPTTRPLRERTGKP
jgi:hypothetical protein